MWILCFFNCDLLTETKCVIEIVFMMIYIMSKRKEETFQRINQRHNDKTLTIKKRKVENHQRTLDGK